MDLGLNFIYEEISKDDIDLIKPLWECLKSHHLKKIVHFIEDFRKKEWRDRKKDLLMDNKDIKVIVVKKTEEVIGYCISTILDNKKGEVDSIYIEEEYGMVGANNRKDRRLL